MENPFLVVGLGNPGPRYQDTRHNIGFAVIDQLAAQWRAHDWAQRYDAEYQTVEREVGGKAGRVHLAKPLTFMNLSGRSVGQIVRFYKLDPATQILILSDDVDLPPGKLRLRLGGGSGGHNGLKSIFEGIGTENYPRLRIGVGRVPGVPTDVHVLEKISKNERPFYEKVAMDAADAVETCLRLGVSVAMNSVNKPKPETA